MDKLYEDAKKMLEIYDWRPEIKCLLYISLALLRSASLMEESRRQIIRCKDCKWCSEHYDTDGNVPYWDCINWDGGTDADGFCHEAELRGDSE